MYFFEVNDQVMKSSKFDEKEVRALLESMEHCSCVVCPGLPAKKYPSPAKRLRVVNEKYQRDKDCLLWHIPKNQKSKIGSVTYNLCTPCKRLHSYLERRLLKPVSPSTKAARSHPSSSYPQTYLSPRSQSQRSKRALVQKYALKRQLTQLKKKASLFLCNEQNEELTKIIAEIQHKHPTEVEKIMKDAEKEGKGELMEAVWRQDIKEHKDFFMDQKRCCELHFCLFT